MAIDCYCNYYLNTDKNGCDQRNILICKIFLKSEKDRHEFVSELFKSVDINKIPFKCSDWVVYGAINQSMCDNICNYPNGCKNNNVNDIPDDDDDDDIPYLIENFDDDIPDDDDDDIPYLIENFDDDIPDLVENFDDVLDVD